MKSVILSFLFLCCASCGLLSPEQQQTALSVVSQLQAQGTVTAEQAAALTQAILADGQGAWWQQLAEMIGAAALAYFGVAWRRGAPTQRVGLPAEKVLPPKV